MGWCVCVCIYIYIYYTNTHTLASGHNVRVFTNDLGDQDSIAGCVMPKTQKMVLDVSLLNTQDYKV